MYCDLIFTTRCSDSETRQVGQGCQERPGVDFRFSVGRRRKCVKGFVGFAQSGKRGAQENGPPCICAGAQRAYSTAQLLQQQHLPRDRCGRTGDAVEVHTGAEDLAPIVVAVKIDRVITG